MSFRILYWVSIFLLLIFQVIADLSAVNSYFDFFSKECDQKVLVGVWWLCDIWDDYLSFSTDCSFNSWRNWRRQKLKWNFFRRKKQCRNYRLNLKICISFPSSLVILFLVVSAYVVKCFGTQNSIHHVSACFLVNWGTSIFSDIHLSKFCCADSARQDNRLQQIKEEIKSLYAPTTNCI